MQYTLIAGYCLLTIAVVILIIEIHAQGKRSVINRARNIIYEGITENDFKSIDKKILKDTLLIGAGASAINLLEIYSKASEHKELLTYIEDKLPTDYSGMSTLEWYQKLFEAKTNDLNEFEKFVNITKGQLAENEALSFLELNGIDGRLADTVIHNEIDIVATTPDGAETAFSVKTGSNEYITESIANHPDTTNFIVNSEAYDYMERNGQIDEYARKGVSVIDGNFSDIALETHVRQSFNEIIDSGDVFNNIPVVSAAFLAFKTTSDIKSYFKKEQTARELGINTLMNVGRIGVASTAFATGAGIGQAVGTVIVPGAGTIIGGVAGGIVGAVITSSIVGNLKENLKWGKIIKTLDYFHEKYHYTLSSAIKDQMINRFFDYNKLNYDIEIEQEIITEYEKDINPYNWKKPRFSAILSYEYLQKLSVTEKRIEATFYGLIAKLLAICEKAVDGNNKKNIDIKRPRIFWDIILSNKWLVESGAFDANDMIQYHNYQSQMFTSGNHPYRLSVNQEELVETCFYSSFNESVVDYESCLKEGLGKFLLVLGALLALVGGRLVIGL